MEKKTLLAVIISIVILVSWDIFFVQPRTPKDLPKKEQQTTAAAPAATSKQVVPLTAAAPAPSPQAALTSGSEIVVETPLYTARWNTRGGQIVSLKLKKYRTDIDKTAPPVELIKAPMPTLLISKGFTDSNIVYECPQKGPVTVDGAPFQLVFSAEVSQGITVRKTFTIDPKTYLLGYQTVVANNTQNPMSISGNLLFNNTYPLDDKGSKYSFEGPVLLYGKHLEEFKISKVKEIGSYRDFSGNVQWFGFEDKYFLQAIISQTPETATISIRRTDAKTIGLQYTVAQANVQPGASLTKDILIFIGPKEIKTLKAVGYNLNKALDFGFFDLIAKPLLIAMNWINTYTNSYGLTIIILTFFIKILLYPLTLKSFTSMKGLQKIQPLMKEIQQQYKDDKPKLNQELMKLYKEHKINPMGGCLPMLLQIPILFALYKVFFSAIELRHTPFHIVGTWLPDLSAKDPYFITPILMGASQFLMQKMTPTAGDPMQQKMMLFMPVIFTFMFLSFPSGLVIYWLISNILTIAQQAYINRKLT
ncbi:MAG: membrane protein insertase YidC [Syntrophaceae bacterium]|nr:membrane protein insertase YidC [Deltaproteobacteria bacterium]